MKELSYKNIDDYIKTCPIGLQEKLYELRGIIKEVIPEAVEKISWSMPTFYLNKNIIHFFLHKHHIGLYPGDKAIEHFKDELTGYKTSKGAIQIPLDQPLPDELIQKIVKFNIKEI